MTKGQLLKKSNNEGKPLYFIGYSNIKYQGKPLLICGTDINNKNTYGQYTEAILQEV